MRKLLLAPLLAMLSLSASSSTGELQFLYTAFLDVQGLFPKTLAACTRADPSTTEPLQALFEKWRVKNAAFQPELQRLIRKNFIEKLGEEKANAFLQQIQIDVKKTLAPLHFPQDHEFKGNYFCTRLLPRDLKGEDLMLNFHEYVIELRKAK